MKALKRLRTWLRRKFGKPALAIVPKIQEVNRTFWLVGFGPMHQWRVPVSIRPVRVELYDPATETYCIVHFGRVCWLDTECFFPDSETALRTVSLAAVRHGFLPVVTTEKGEPA